MLVGLAVLALPVLPWYHLSTCFGSCVPVRGCSFASQVVQHCPIFLHLEKGRLDCAFAELARERSLAQTGFLAANSFKMTYILRYCEAPMARRTLLHRCSRHSRGHDGLEAGHSYARLREAYMKLLLIRAEF